MGKLLLTSAGFLNPNIANLTKKILGDLSVKSVAIITTAAEGKENNKYSQLARKQLWELGFKEVSFFDLETEDTSDLLKYEVLYVCGGNTFKLMKFANTSNFKKAVISLLDRNGLYIGVSAGSLIVGPSIQIANEIEPDPNNVNLKSLEGLKITKVIVFPHYEEKYENQIRQFEEKYKLEITRLTNFQAVVVEDKNITKIE